MYTEGTNGCIQYVIRYYKNDNITIRQVAAYITDTHKIVKQVHDISKLFACSILHLRHTIIYQTDMFFNRILRNDFQLVNERDTDETLSAET